VALAVFAAGVPGSPANTGNENPQAEACATIQLFREATTLFGVRNQQAPMNFHSVEENLRQSFRALAAGRARADVIELPGVSVASLGVTFQMFNAAFLSAPVGTQTELEDRLRTAGDHFHARGLRWSWWICEDWLGTGIRRKLSRTCEAAGLRLSSEMPGMAADRIAPVARKLPQIEIRRVNSVEALDDFRALGSTCFHVPIAWFSEVFNEDLVMGGSFVCWVAYHDGLPVATAAAVVSKGVTGLYNIATGPEYRHRGCAEAITRHVIEWGAHECNGGHFVLQSTHLGQRLYERMGFRPVTRVLVYNSTR
jgi:ribosomal protein S18 acetylase RimI-like enzyme